MIIIGLVKICLFQPFTYTELGRLQTENIKLKNNIEQLNIEEQLISTDNKVRFYTGIPSKSLFLWMVTLCSACRFTRVQSNVSAKYSTVYFHETHLIYNINILHTALMYPLQPYHIFSTKDYQKLQRNFLFSFSGQIRTT